MMNRLEWAEDEFNLNDLPFDILSTLVAGDLAAGLSLSWEEFLPNRIDGFYTKLGEVGAITVVVLCAVHASINVVKASLRIGLFNPGDQQ